MERKIPLFEGECFHIYNRGVDKRKIFLDSHDYNRFIILLYLCNSNLPVDLQKIFREGRTFNEIFSIDRGDRLIDIGAWVLMPNHFHLLARQNCSDGLSVFMRKLCTGYSNYFNQKNNRLGALFQGRFKSEHASDDRYLKYLFSYIHLNPVKLIPGEENWKEVGIKNPDNASKFINNYEYSSLHDYRNETLFSSLVNKELFSSISDDLRDMVESVNNWL
ncbi:MAG: transposase [Minisyncoccia bacterium]